ncbi:radical SAM protein [Chloroflexota bacterium]
MITGLHLLLSYKCNFECDHCFLYCSPRSQGTFTLDQIRKVLNEAAKINTVETIFFEGGEPFLYYPIMIEGIKIARSIGFKAGVVTNAYYALAEEDAEVWLKPLAELGVSNLSISNDAYHYGDNKDNSARCAFNVAKRLNITSGEIAIEEPAVETSMNEDQDKGEPVIGGTTMFRGRAVEKLTAGLPKRHWEEFTECPYEDLSTPKRVHIDPYGNVHLCQGLSMGNLWETPLSKLDANYNAASHPISGPLVKGGPALLVKEHSVEHENEYIDACHFCYLARLAMIDRFPQYLAPRQVYGLE